MVSEIPEGCKQQGCANDVLHRAEVAVLEGKRAALCPLLTLVALRLSSESTMNKPFVSSINQCQNSGRHMRIHHAEGDYADDAIATARKLLDVA